MLIASSSPGPSSYEPGVAILSCGLEFIFGLLKNDDPKIPKSVKTKTFSSS